MAYNQSDRSELERRFEALFSQVFHCPWQEHLQAQHHVQIDGKNYYIDYVYIGQGRKIAIELDGHSKIKDAADSTRKFHDLLARQNDLMGQGFEVYRWGWHHVVSMGGWRARRDLQRIFKGLIESKRTEASGSFNALPVLWKPRKSGSVSAYTESRRNPIQSVHADVVDAQVFYPSQRKKAGWFQGVGVGLLALAVIALLFNKTQPAPEPQNTYSSDVQESETPITNTSTSLEDKPQPRVTTKSALPQANKVVTKTVYVPVAVPTPVSKASVKSVDPDKAVQAEPVTPNEVILPPSIQPQAMSQQTQTPTLAEPATPKPAIEPDEIVAFNQESGIFHNPNSYWGRKCTRNCIFIPKSQAIQMGGRPSRSQR
jgi:hypothetical protein